MWRLRSLRLWHLCHSWHISDICHKLSLLYFLLSDIKSLNSNSYSKTYRYPHMWPSHQLKYRGWSVTLHHGDHFQTSNSTMSTDHVSGVTMWRHDIWTGPGALLQVSMGSRCCSVTGHNPMRMTHVILPILILYSLRLSYTSYLNPFYLTYAYNHRHTLFIYFPLAQQ